MTHRRESPARGVNDASEDLLHRRHDMLDGETEILEQHAARRELAEAVDADDGAAAVVDRHVLAREQQARRTVVALDRGDPSERGFDRVARAPDVEVGDQTQTGRMLDRLMRGAVLTEANRIVRIDGYRTQFHQRSQP